MPILSVEIARRLGCFPPLIRALFHSILISGNYSLPLSGLDSPSFGGPQKSPTESSSRRPITLMRALPKGRDSMGPKRNIRGWIGLSPTREGGGISYNRTARLYAGGRKERGFPSRGAYLALFRVAPLLRVLSRTGFPALCCRKVGVRPIKKSRKVNLRRPGSTFLILPDRASRGLPQCGTLSPFFMGDAAIPVFPESWEAGGEPGRSYEGRRAGQISQPVLRSRRSSYPNKLRGRRRQCPLLPKSVLSSPCSAVVQSGP